MKRRPRPEEEPELFDLPLSDDAVIEDERPAEPPAEPDEEAPLFPEWTADEEIWLDDPDEEPLVTETTPATERGIAAPKEPGGVTPLSRLVAGLLDLAVLLAVAIAVWAGLRWLGIRPTVDDWPAALTFNLTFSFLYFVLPLAFWSRTPGMARVGLSARNADGVHLSFGQAVARWLGALVTGFLAGLPLLLSFTGRSLSDRLSGSETETG